MNSKVLLITPPFTQLNTLYPATAYLQGFLESKSINSYQVDLGIEVLLNVFSKKGLTRLFCEGNNPQKELSDNTLRILYLQDKYINTIDDTIRFLQGKNEMLAHTICNETFLPEASRFNQLEDLEWAFGSLGIRDKARHMATLYLEDISDYIVEVIDPHFGFSRYAERISSSAYSFDPIYNELLEDDSVIIELQNQILEQHIKDQQPNLIAITVPFPGNLFAALKCGQFIKTNYPNIRVAIGGGYPNTELRSVSDIRLFEFIDFITLDDGESPLLNLIEYIEDKREINHLKRTLICRNNTIEFIDNSETKEISLRENIAPSYAHIKTDQYLSVIEITNPMHRLWSDGFWNKLTMAHGCYWGRCTFCDTSLDYIARFEPVKANVLCDKVERIIEQTGKTAFHFVDEAAPPALMVSFAKEIIKRKLNIVWWTNIRFESSFTYDVCRLLKQSGCIAVSGGLEVASDRILSLINKGVSVKKVAQVCKNFTKTGILTHAYLMYGFPTQTTQETIDSMEIVRQLFEHQIVHSGFWHQFALTTHSPVGANPNKFQIEIMHPEENPFANNDLEHKDPTGASHYKFSEGLKKSLFNYMHDVGFDLPLQEWFDFEVPEPTIPNDFIYGALQENINIQNNPNSQMIWPHNLPVSKAYKRKKKGKQTDMCELSFHLLSESETLNVKESLGKWIIQLLEKCSLNNNKTPTLKEIETNFSDNNLGDFSIFMESFTAQKLKEFGLLII
ncbi:radical SAM protein [Labilibacter sediminis]|nr:radical SAM protein [Labilibacter sediminis]